MFLVVLLLVGAVDGAASESAAATTKTYDLEVPGSDPIRIVEGEPLWTSTPRLEQRSFRSRDEHPLHQFLATYSKKHNNRVENTEAADSDRPKNWDLMQHHTHNHPYDDKKGWVSMEPVPWSISKVSRWESSQKPDSKPWESDYDEAYTKPTPTWNKPTTTYYLDRKPESKPLFTKPSAVYGQKVHVDLHKKYQHKHEGNCRHDSEEDIITDGLPPNFPQAYEANRRRGTEMLPDTHPLSGEGEWVLLSTTKGYKLPQQRQRALQVNPDSIGAHRGVRLTVLPPLKNSKVNMTTSHGGLLQVESTFQTVEQSRKQQLKKKEKAKKRRPAQQVPPVRQQQIFTPAVTTTRRNTGPDSSTVLAAVGAGMIPATMAMLVPMALGGRRKREVTHVTGPPTFQITLPRNLH